MDRRRFLSWCAASAALPSASMAGMQCGPVYPPGLQQCTAGIASSMAHVSARSQRQSQWCWAACISMVFGYHGYSVEQDRIVAETWGGIVNLPGSPYQILADLNRAWTDDRGRAFGVMGDVFTANPATASQDLAQDQPLIIGTMGHAMVLTAVSFVRDRYGNGQVTQAIVRDPWPGRGRRVMSPQEWYATNFLARIRVS